MKLEELWVNSISGVTAMSLSPYCVSFVFWTLLEEGCVAIEFGGRRYLLEGELFLFAALEISRLLYYKFCF